MELSRRLSLRFLFIHTSLYRFLRRSPVPKDLKAMWKLSCLMINRISNQRKENLTRSRSITIHLRLSRKLPSSLTANKSGNLLFKIIAFCSFQSLEKFLTLCSSCTLSTTLRKRFSSLISLISYRSNLQKRKSYSSLF